MKNEIFSKHTQKKEIVLERFFFLNSLVQEQGDKKGGSNTKIAFIIVHTHHNTSLCDQLHV